jgi:hypothetical protein
MKQQNDAMFAICNTIKDTSASHTPHTERFKVKYSLQLKNVKLSKGERVTATFVIKTLTAAKDIDIAANKAITRKPQTDSEWQSFFKFHLAHMTDILHEEMSIIVENHTFTDTHLFWTQVFKKIFPNEMAMDAFDKALTSYMVWNEPLGIERWEGITRNLLAHKAVMSGKTVDDLHMCMAEGMAHQLQRLVMACPESYSAPLFEKYTSVYAEILEHKDDGTPVSSVMYDQANGKFLKQLKMKLNAYHGTTIFGHAFKDSKHPENPAPAPQPSQTMTPIPQINHVPKNVPPPPSFSQVTQVGGQGYMGGAAPSAAPQPAPTYPPAILPHVYANKKPFPPNHSRTAPNGNLRTWGWWLVTKPNGSGPRIPCNDPPPPEAAGQGCEYYGDWLDVQGLCVYCNSKDHKKDACAKYAQAVARFPKKDTNGASTSVQGNSVAPAQ